MSSVEWCSIEPSSLRDPPPSIAKYPATSPHLHRFSVANAPPTRLSQQPLRFIAKNSPLSTLTNLFEMAIAPIVGKLKRGLIIDLSLAIGFGTAMGSLFWYGYHVPGVRYRDAYQAKLELQRIKNAQ